MGNELNIRPADAPLKQGDVVVADGDLVIRRMHDHDSDYSRMAYWRDLPHVRRWWDHDLPPATLQSMREECQADTTPDAVSVACFIVLDERPIGFIQFYRWASYADEALEVGIPFDDRTYSLDVFIGEPSAIGRGIGTRVVALLSNHLIDTLHASAVSLTTDVNNLAAQRCYEKAGFRRLGQVVDTDTYMGERILSWLMVKPGRAHTGDSADTVEQGEGGDKVTEDRPTGVVFTRTVPILRIFDIAKAHEFYVDYLGFIVDWEHRFSETAPLYMQISRENLILHLSEHHGDGTPGSAVYVEMRGVRELHAGLAATGYPYLRPGIEVDEIGTCITLVDPFVNILRLNEPPLGGKGRETEG